MIGDGDDDTGGYVLRVFATGPINLEKVPPLHMECRGGEWAKSSSMDTTGGPPRVLVGGEEGGGGGGLAASASIKRHLVDNGKWCQNSQFHLRLDDKDAGGSDDVFLKVGGWGGDEFCFVQRDWLGLSALTSLHLLTFTLIHLSAINDYPYWL